MFDTDGDGIPDEADRCVESSVAFISGPSNDIDGDGCHDISEDSDDDDDGRPDTSDRCARGLIGWDSTDTSFDHDSDGCQDASEDDGEDDSSQEDDDNDDSTGDDSTEEVIIPDKSDLNKMKKSDIVKLAKSLDLDSKGSKKELIERITQ